MLTSVFVVSSRLQQLLLLKEFFFCGPLLEFQALKHPDSSSIGHFGYLGMSFSKTTFYLFITSSQNLQPKHVKLITLRMSTAPVSIIPFNPAIFHSVWCPINPTENFLLDQFDFVLMCKCIYVAEYTVPSPVINVVLEIPVPRIPPTLCQAFQGC